MNFKDVLFAKKGLHFTDNADGANTFGTLLVKRMSKTIYTWETERMPYISRLTAGALTIAGMRLKEELVGGTVIWNQLVRPSDTSVTVPNSHIYFSNIDGIQAIAVSNGTSIEVSDGEEDMIHDLTQMFGAAIANYIYNLEQVNVGKGISFFKALFAKPHYEFDSGTPMSVNTSAHVMRNANNKIIRQYELDGTLILMGIPRLTDKNELYYDGDIYESSGKVTRKIGAIDLGALSWVAVSGYNGVFKCTFPQHTDSSLYLCSKYLAQSYWNSVSSMPDKSVKGYPNTTENTLYIKDTAYSSVESFKEAMQGELLIYKLETPVIESGEPFQQMQICDPKGTEEYVDDRQVEIPVGHNTQYQVIAG